MPIRNRRPIGSLLHRAGDRLRIVKFAPLQPISTAMAGRTAAWLRSGTPGPPFQHFYRGQRSMILEVPKSNETPDPRIRKRVLIVEDNDLNTKLFNDLLVAHGSDMVRCRRRTAPRRWR